MDGHGRERLGQAWTGEVSYGDGMVWQAWRVGAWNGRERSVELRKGGTRHGTAGMAGKSPQGMNLLVEALRSEAGEDWYCELRRRLLWFGRDW